MRDLYKYTIVYENNWREYVSSKFTEQINRTLVSVKVLIILQVNLQGQNN